MVKTMKKVFYIVTYARFENGVLANDGSLATARKVDYVAESIVENGYEVEIISPVRPKKKFAGIKKQKKLQLTKGVILVESPYIGDYKDFVFRRLRNVYSKLWLFSYLIRNIKRDDIVIYYHNCIYAKQLLLAHKIKKFKVILEIEDIFHKVWNISKKETRNEKLLLHSFNKNCITAADTIIVDLNLVDSIVSYGSYNVFPGTIPNKRNKERITLICTGSIDKERGIGLMALDVMSKLNDKYQLLISGTITDECKDDFFSSLNEINRNAGYEKCRYLGILNERDYESLLLSADIALNPQKQGTFDKYVFPSKILTYLGYNLEVVTTPGESIVSSDLRHILYISKDYNTQSIADCIESINIDAVHKDYRQDLLKMDKEFKNNMKELLERI